MKTIVLKTILLPGALLLGSMSVQAASLKISPQAPAPGDVVTLTVYPAAGEKITGIGMAAWDTSEVKFSMKENGMARAFVGFPFDRSGGPVTLRARVRVEKDGGEQEQVLASTFTARARSFPTQRFSMKGPGAATMNRTSALRAERIYVQSRMKTSSPSPLWTGSWVVPASGRPSSPYGRKRWINGKWWGQHNGSDIKASSGTPVAATNAGRVVLSEYLPTLRGNCVVIDHGCNIFSLYLHLSKRDVSVGQSVARGQRIGAVGSTGFSTGPHLHWEMRVGWEPVDPYQFTRRGVSF